MESEKVRINMDVELKNTRQRYTKCQLCNVGTYGGIFYRCCDNSECKLYDSFVMHKCGACGTIRRDCCC